LPELAHLLYSNNSHLLAEEAAHLFPWPDGLGRRPRTCAARIDVIFVRHSARDIIHSYSAIGKETYAMKIDPDELLTVGEAAELRGVTHQSISYLVKMGRVRTIAIRGRTYIYRKDIEEFTRSKPGPQPKATAKKRVRKSL